MSAQRLLAMTAKQQDCTQRDNVASGTVDPASAASGRIAYTAYNPVSSHAVLCSSAAPHARCIHSLSNTQMHRPAHVQTLHLDKHGHKVPGHISFAVDIDIQAGITIDWGSRHGTVLWLPIQPTITNLQKCLHTLCGQALYISSAAAEISIAAQMSASAASPYKCLHLRQVLRQHCLLKLLYLPALPSCLLTCPHC